MDVLDAVAHAGVEPVGHVNDNDGAAGSRQGEEIRSDFLHQLAAWIATRAADHARVVGDYRGCRIEYDLSHADCLDLARRVVEDAESRAEMEVMDRLRVVGRAVRD